jgi:Ca-activated chloride channel family protein
MRWPEADCPLSQHAKEWQTRCAAHIPHCLHNFAQVRDQPPAPLSGEEIAKMRTLGGTIETLGRHAAKIGTVFISLPILIIAAGCEGGPQGTGSYGASAQSPAPVMSGSGVSAGAAASAPSPSPSTATPVRRTSPVPGSAEYLSAPPSLPAPAPLAMPGAAAQFANAPVNPVVAVRDQPVSTFSLDVDTASYAIARRFLVAGRRPPAEAVRVEQFINYFPYDYQRPAGKDEPFALTVTVMPSPWNKNAQLLHIGLKAFEIVPRERPPLNLVLLIDVSGSMAPPDRLPLLKDAFRALSGELRPIDRVAIVTYANNVSTALPPTSGDQRDKILAVIDALTAQGGTAGGDGIRRAYALAEQNFDAKAVNRIVLATDGDFNVGIRDPKTLERFVAEKRKTGIYLSVFGVGLDNLNDRLMQMLAHAGNGNAAHIDTALEARKVLTQELAATVFPVADDAKIQVEFNPARVAEYRLIGYETRLLRRQDFNDDKVDAGDIGSGHSVTAIYEMASPDSKARLIDPLRYQPDAAAPAKAGAEIAFVRLRYKQPGQSESRAIERAVVDADVRPTLAAVPADTRFAVAVAGFGQLLRGDSAVDGYGYQDIVDLAEPARGRDPYGYRAEFVQLVRIAGGLRR